MNKVSALFAATAAAAILLSATPALASENGSDEGGLHVGTFVSTFLHGLNGSSTVDLGITSDHRGNDNDRDDHASSSTTTDPVAKHAPKTFEIGTVSSVNSSAITLSPVISLGASATASPNVLITGSTKFKGASSSASLTSGENVLIVGTTSTSSPGTITASLVIALQDIGRFFHHLLDR